MLRLGSRSIWRRTATSSGAVPGPAPRVRRPPPKRPLAEPSRGRSFSSLPSGRALSGRAQRPLSAELGPQPDEALLTQWPARVSGARAALIRRTGAQRCGPFRPGRGGLGMVVMTARCNPIRGSVGRARRRAGPAEKGRLLGAGLGSLRLRPGGGDLEENEGAGPRGLSPARARGVGGHTERQARSLAGAAASPERRVRTAEPLGAPRPGWADIRARRSRPPRQRPQIGGAAAPRVTAGPQPTPLPFSFLLPSAAPRDASAAPGPLRRGRLLPWFAERKRRHPREEGWRAQGPACPARAAGDEMDGPSRRAAAPRTSACQPGAGCHQLQPLGSSGGPEPRPSPSPEPLGVSTARRRPCAPSPWLGLWRGPHSP